MNYLPTILLDGRGKFNSCGTGESEDCTKKKLLQFPIHCIIWLMIGAEINITYIHNHNMIAYDRKQVDNIDLQ